ncbi:PAS domain-containing protein [Phytopseudomonas dryadis]|uniref:histidine kinase n=1 Tax=Phytopseudomonas dryadis TaxID=2487520 RepID=A0ABY1Z221_9GAMM|nr:MULTISPECIES: PAS domain-containing protein [Pseudomonas]TBV02224.1 diguanylate cyclase [Pseudomonas dryadis]TBV15167.1 diguanylate cyclase [Pseudomonas sp. FRB 230]
MSWRDACHAGLLRLRAGLARLSRGAQRHDGFDQLPLALVCLDAAGRMTRLNPAWEELTGYPCRDCLRRSHAQFLHLEDQPLWQQGLQALRDGQRDWLRILRYPHRGGELHWAEVRLRRRADGFIASLADVTAQMPQRQQLQARHRSLSNLLDGLPLMVYRCRNNRHWSMEYVSAGCLALTGYQPEQLIDSHSLTFNDLIHPADRERVWHSVQQGLRGRQPFTFEYRLLCADGSEKAVLERGCGIYSDAGDVLGLEGVVLQRQEHEAGCASRLPAELGDRVPEP